MARVNVPITAATEAGTTIPAAVSADATNDHEIPSNDGRVVLEVENTHATLARTVTIVTPQTVGAQSVSDNAVSIPALSKKIIGPLPPRTYNQQSGADAGKVYIDVAENTDLKLRAFSF
jgi:hypothetical protein